MPWEKNSARKEVLHGAMNLFWRVGYENASVDDVVRATGASRYGLYDEFGDKRGLYLETLDWYREKIIVRNLGSLMNADAVVEDIHKFFDRLLYPPRDRESLGCLMCMTAMGFGKSDKEAAAKVNSSFDMQRGVFLRALENSGKPNGVSSSTSPEDLSVFLTGLVQGGAILSRSGADTETKATFYSVGLSLLP